MVACFLILCSLVAVTPVWGAPQRQLCLSCHSAHYIERGNCTLCHIGNPASARKNIAHDGIRAGKYLRFTRGDAAFIREGERLMEQLACRRCHVSGGRGNRLAVNLDASAVQKTAGELSHSIHRPVATMPVFGLDDGRITTLVNIILAGSQGRDVEKAAPVRVHFINAGTKNTDIFTTKCGSCHRMLSQRRGAVGSGEVAPNLSGLFSSQYPSTFRNGEAWTARNLGRWLKNPREIRVWAKMQPVMLTDTEMQELESLFFVSPQ